MIKRYFNVELDKRFQRVDWSKRPLKQEMIEYSVGDVAYLIKLHDIIKNELEKKGRLAWAAEECELQAKVRYENNHTLPLFKKFKGAGKMDNRTLAVLENLLQMRLSIAQKKDKPLFKVISNRSLADMALYKPLKAGQMVKEKMISEKQADMYGSLCEKAITSALEMAHKSLPSYPRTRRPWPDQKVKDRIKQLKKMREKLSVSLGIEPGFLLNNALIGELAFSNPKSRHALEGIDNLRKWQIEAMGESIITNLGYCRA